MNRLTNNFPMVRTNSVPSASQRSDESLTNTPARNRCGAGLKPGVSSTLGIGQLWPFRSMAPNHAPMQEAQRSGNQ